MLQYIPSPRAFRIFASFLLLLLAKPFAVPLYYSFEGEVIYSTIESYALGKPVRYVFLVDQERDGYTVDGSGTARTVEDYIESADFIVLSFYSQYIGGDALTADNPLSPNKESSFAGVDRVFNGDDIFSAVRGSNTDPSGFDLLDIWTVDARINDWAVGQSLLGENLVQNEEGMLNSSYSSSLTLTGITEFNPLETTAAVPEPSTFALLGMGLLGLGAMARRARK